MSTVTMQVPVEPALLKKAEAVLDGLGLDMNSAVRVFLKKVVATQSIPFALAEEPKLYGFSPEETEEILKSAADAKDPEQLSATFNSAEDLISHLRKAKP